jgi:hypothetical protein
MDTYGIISGSWQDWLVVSGYLSFTVFIIFCVFLGTTK